MPGDREVNKKPTAVSGGGFLNSRERLKPNRRVIQQRVCKQQV
jgi:hypothetical protein